MRTISLTIATILTMFFINKHSCLGQTRQEKTDSIIHLFNLIEIQKSNYNFNIEHLKSDINSKDSLKIIEIEKKLTNAEIQKRINIVFSETYTDSEINEIYEFTKTKSFKKLFNNGGIYVAIANKFKDIAFEIKELLESNNTIVDSQLKKFEPINIDRKNGFYATIDYNLFKDTQEINLEENPRLTFQDFLEVKKIFNKNNEPEIFIKLSKEGAQKFSVLTKENLFKPTALVIDKKIVSMPKVYSHIKNGIVIISGNHSENEIDNLIESLKKIE